MTVMHELNDVILSLGLFGVVAVVFIESAFPFGFFLPGDTVLFAAGLFAAKGQFPIAFAILMIFLANFAGVTIGYWTGRGVGKRYVSQESKLLFRHEYVEKAEKFYAKHGGKAIVLGRFIPAVRSFVPIIAGVAKMDYRHLMFYNAIGAAIWATSVPLVGYFSGNWLEAHGISIELLVMPILLLVIVVSLAGPLVHALGNKRTRAKLFAKLRR